MKDLLVDTLVRLECCESNVQENGTVLNDIKEYFKKIEKELANKDEEIKALKQKMEEANSGSLKKELDDLKKRVKRCESEHNFDKLDCVPQLHDDDQQPNMLDIEDIIEIRAIDNLDSYGQNFWKIIALGGERKLVVWNTLIPKFNEPKQVSPPFQCHAGGPCWRLYLYCDLSLYLSAGKVWGPQAKGTTFNIDIDLVIEDARKRRKNISHLGGLQCKRLAGVQLCDLHECNYKMFVVKKALTLYISWDCKHSFTTASRLPAQF